MPDDDAGIAFYVGKVGLRLVKDIVLSANKGWVLLGAGEQAHILLAKANGPEQDAAVGNQTGGRVGFFLHSDNFEADFDRMRVAGVAFEEEPRVEPYGTVAVWRDPWGNRWDLLQLT